jgi:hypothetical protein
METFRSTRASYSLRQTIKVGLVDYNRNLDHRGKINLTTFIRVTEVDFFVIIYPNLKQRKRFADLVSDSELGSDSGDDVTSGNPTKNRLKSGLDKNNIDEYLKDDSDVYEPENETDEEGDNDEFDEDVVQGKHVHLKWESFLEKAKFKLRFLKYILNFVKEFKFLWTKNLNVH